LRSSLPASSILSRTLSPVLWIDRSRDDIARTCGQAFCGLAFHLHSPSPQYTTYITHIYIRPATCPSSLIILPRTPCAYSPRLSYIPRLPHCPLRYLHFLQPPTHLHLLVSSNHIHLVTRSCFHFISLSLWRDAGRRKGNELETGCFGRAWKEVIIKVK